MCEAAHLILDELACYSGEGAGFIATNRLEFHCGQMHARKFLQVFATLGFQC